MPLVESPNASAAVADSTRAATSSPAAASVAAAVPMPPEETITCPNCGEVQRKQVFCRSCTTNMPMGIAAKKEDAERARAERQGETQTGRGRRMSAVSDRVAPPPLLSLSLEGRMGRISYFNAGGLAILGITLLAIAAAALLLTFRKPVAMIPFAAAGMLLLVWALRLTVLRLHDFNRSGWWALLLLIPYVGILANAVMYLMPGSPQDNDHGEKPRTGNGLVAVLVVLAYATSLFAYFRMSST